ncbi:MAG: phage portal protein [Lachnospira sp.]|nr:phage portal protein [Lachnospira sp.]
MFNFLTQNKKGELVDILDAIAANTTRLNLAAMAQDRAVDLIADAIAKSEIVITDGHNRRYDKQYYRLNVQPNLNQTGTDFWRGVVRKMLKEGECLVVRVADQYFQAETYTADSYVMHEKTYKDVTITDGRNTYMLDTIFPESSVLMFQLRNESKLIKAASVMQAYDSILSALSQMEILQNKGIFKYKYDANGAFVHRNPDGSVKRLVIDDVVKDVVDKITAAGITIIPQSQGTDLTYLGIESKTSAAEITSIASEINAEAARVYNIPVGVFNCQITEQSDATNEFITYSVQPVAETITDSLNAKLVGMDDYIRGERCFVWLAHYKHIDILDAADKLDKLRADGWSFDELRELVGYEPLNTDFSTARAITKNYTMEGKQEGGGDGPADDAADESVKLSKHKERRKRRSGN